MEQVACPDSGDLDHLQIVYRSVIKYMLVGQDNTLSWSVYLVARIFSAEAQTVLEILVFLGRLAVCLCIL